ncbi:MAG: DUF2934 domain-containing protein [Thermodesulfovibrionales bacterium]|nr:DUF2934 domain-containing protein [Thermodesulfovibrionales bacterium]
MDLKEEISKLAYEIYVKSGCIEGRDLDNWLEAERLVLERYSVKDVSKDKDTKTKKTSASVKKSTEKAKSETVKRKTQAKNLKNKSNK